MYRESFPKCKVQGEQDPSSMRTHMTIKFAVPKKCLACEFLFEGECTRGIDQMDGYLRLDTGPCNVQGSTQPVVAGETSSGNELFIPKKCKACPLLDFDSIRGFVCTQDKHLWGDGFRDLDWESWTPDVPNIGLSRYVNRGKYRVHIGPAVVTQEIIKLIQEGKKTKALIIYRKLNDIEYIKEAKDDIEKLEIKIKNGSLMF
jgi:hypothetical protein